MVTKMGINGMHSVMGRNLRLMESRFGMEECNVYKVWGQKCDNERNADYVYKWENCVSGEIGVSGLSLKKECESFIIDFLCTNWILIMCILLYLKCHMFMCE